MKPVTREAKPIPVPVEGTSLAPAELKTAPAPQYKGDPLRKPVTIEFREMDLSNVVALLAQQADINVIAGTEITGTVTASLKNIPLMEAMEVVLGMNGLGIVKEGSIYRIVSIDEAIAAKRTTRLVVLECAAELGITVRFEGTGADEKGYDANTGQCLVAVDSRYFRPTEVETLLGDPTKARERLGWQPRITLEEMVAEMVRCDLRDAQRDALCKSEGYTVFDGNE